MNAPYEYIKYKLQLVKEDSVASLDHYEISSPFQAHQFLTKICKLLLNPQGVFLVIALNAKGSMIGYHTASIGILISTRIHPRESFKFLIQCNASAAILAHNYPSENPNPSREDFETTKQLVQAGNLFRIPVLDHIIVGNESDFVSLKKWNCV